MKGQYLKNMLLIALIIVSVSTFVSYRGGGGSGDGGGSSAGTAIPATPTALTAITGDTQIQLSWAATTGATSYNIYWSTNPGVTNRTGTNISVTANSYSHTGLTNGTLYYYVVTARNSQGESGESSQIAVKPINVNLVGVGAIVKVAQSASIPYSYYYYIPTSSLSKPVVALVLSALAGPNPANSYADVESRAYEAVTAYQQYADASGLIIFSVAIPAAMQGIDWNQTGSAQILHRANFETATGVYFRPDLKFLDVFNGFKSLLAQAPLVVDPQIFVTGFSSGGMWANRFPLLYPGLVKAAAPGAAGGIYTMPLSSYQGTLLTYHMGIQDIQGLGLSAFDVGNFEKIPFFVFTGEIDDNDALDCGIGNGCSGLSWDQIVFYKTAFGNTPPQRAYSFHNQLLALGMNSTFKSYTGVGHAFTDDMKKDVMDFFNSFPINTP